MRERACTLVLCLAACGDDAPAGLDADVPDAAIADAAPDASGPCGAPRIATGDARVDAYLTWLEARMATDQVPGAAFALIRDGVIEHEAVLGERELGACLPVTVDTLFRLEPVSRVPTAAVLLAGVDDGLLTLDTSLQQRVGEFDTAAGDAAAVLLRHALTHSAGWPWIWEIPNCQIADPAAWWTAHQDVPLWFAPGTITSFDNHMMSLAALALERSAPPSTFDQLADQLMFTPLGMGATYRASEALARDHARGHIDGALHRNQLLIDCPSINPANHAWASIHDMALLARELLTGDAGVLGAGRDGMLTAQAPGLFVDTGLTFGLETLDYDPETPLVVASGWASYAAYVVLMPEEDTALVMLNNAGVNPIPYADAAMSTLFDRSYQQADSATAPATWGEYAGTYVDPLGPRTMEISFDGDELFADLDGTVVELVPSSVGGGAELVDTFRLDYLGTSTIVRFWRDELDAPYAIAAWDARLFGPPFYRQ